MQRGQSELVSGNADAAARSFRQGHHLFVQAARQADGFQLRVLAWFPIAGRTPDAISAVADSAATASEATIVLADGAASVPGGLAGLAPSSGRIALERIPPLAEAAAEADALMADALRGLEEAPTSLLLGPVGPARRRAETEVRDLSESIHATHLILASLPRFLGVDRPRLYFFGAQNPAELRGTGGLIGAYSILEIDNGLFRFSPFVQIHDLASPQLSNVPAPNEDYVEHYDRFRRGGRFWTSINVMPDLPSVGREILSAYRIVTGDALDGVILADPFAASALLDATGPAVLPHYGVELTADNVVPFSTNAAYSLIDDPAKRKRLLGAVVETAFKQFVSQEAHDPVAIRRIVEAAADRHIQIFSTDQDMEQALMATSVGGAIDPPRSGGKGVSVVVNSAAGSKVDFYQDRTVDYTVRLGDDGRGSSDLQLTLHNDAPTTGEPRYVIGPFPDDHPAAGPILRGLDAGDSVALANVYCGHDCIPRQARLDGADVEVPVLNDLGMRYAQSYFKIASGEARTLQVTWDDPSAWSGNSSGGIYQMTFANQITIRPSRVSLRIEPPDGMPIVSASAPLRIEDGVAVYQGRPGSRLDVAVEFAPSLPTRLWRDVTRFLNTPLF
jgi:hypothetical protein